MLNLEAEAVAMGLEGGDVVNFLYQEQESYRNERAEERAVWAAEAEHKAAEAEREIEREVRAADVLEREKVRVRNLYVGID